MPLRISGVWADQVRIYLGVLSGEEEEKERGCLTRKINCKWS
jgi:hypothetical protein